MYESLKTLLETQNTRGHVAEGRRGAGEAETVSVQQVLHSHWTHNSNFSATWELPDLIND